VRRHRAPGRLRLQAGNDRHKKDQDHHVQDEFGPTKQITACPQQIHAENNPRNLGKK